MADSLCVCLRVCVSVCLCAVCPPVIGAKTLSLGDPAKPALFFVHGWPDSAVSFSDSPEGLIVSAI